jgi:NTP pyrophosphatase (non-canonical NTP hydrolase)
MPDLDSLSEAMSAAVEFRDERDWAQYHTPRHLSSAITIEAGELQETLLWKTDEEVASMLEAPDQKEEVADEVGDILILTLLFCHEVGIDPLEAIGQKLSKNESKYPAEEARGRSTKYTDL